MNEGARTNDGRVDEEALRNIIRKHIAIVEVELRASTDKSLNVAVERLLARRAA